MAIRHCRRCGHLFRASTRYSRFCWDCIDPRYKKSYIKEGFIWNERID